jgi:hypothetical protein
MDEQQTIEMAGRCRETADMLERAAVEAGYDTDAPDFLRDTLLRLYYAIRLEEKIGICEDTLTEETDGDTVEAVLAASAAVDAASARMFAQVESYAAGDDAFATEIDAAALSDKADGLMDLLKKLYKCEGIIRMAYRCCARYPIYGARAIDDARLRGEENTPVSAQTGQPPEEYITQKMGIDIDSLYMIRQKLMEMIAANLPEGDA